MSRDKEDEGRARFAIAVLMVAFAGACTTLPVPKRTWHSFPKDAFIGDVKRPYKVLGQVRTKVEYQSLDMDQDEDPLCENYFNKAAEDLVKRAREVGADAVIDVKSVVFFHDGRHELHPRAECSDDGMEGQVLAQGLAVKWKKEEAASSPSATP